MECVRYTSPQNGEIAIEFEVSASTNEIVMMVKYNGSRIAQEELPHIFERFYRVEADPSATGNASSGTGLGLAIVKEIVQYHQGRVWVDSNVNEGSTFNVALPIWKGRSVRG